MSFEQNRMGICYGDGKDKFKRLYIVLLLLLLVMMMMMEEEEDEE